MIRQTPRARRHFRRRRSRTRGCRGPLATTILIVGVISAIGLAIFGVRNGGFDVGVHSAWRELVHAYRDSGEPVYFEDVVPPALPDEHNFFAGPVFAPMLPGATPAEPGLLQRALHPGRGLQVSNLLAAAAQAPGGASLDTIATMLLRAGLTNPKTDYILPGDRVLAAMKQIGLDFQPLIATADRRGSRFPINYSSNVTPDLPHLPYLEAVGDWLAIKAISEISVGSNDPAAIDTLLIWRLAASVAAEPFLKSQQTRRKLLGLFASCIRVGIQRSIWSDDQLAAFGSALENNQALTDLAWALRGERSQLNSIVHDALSDRKPAASPEVQAWLGEDVASVDMRGLRVRQVAANRSFQHLIDAVSAEAVSPDNLLPPPEISADIPPSALDHLATLAAEAAIFAQIQVLLGQTEIACALERFRLANGTYPDNLAELEPEWITSLPSDPLTGLPPEYATPTAGGYTLTSPGWSGPDNPSPWVWTRTAD